MPGVAWLAVIETGIARLTVRERLAVALMLRAFAAPVVLKTVAALAAVVAFATAAVVVISVPVAAFVVETIARLEAVTLLTALLVVESRLAFLEAVAVTITFSITFSIAVGSLCFRAAVFENARLLIVQAGLLGFHGRKRLHVAAVTFDHFFAGFFSAFRTFTWLGLARLAAAVRSFFALGEGFAIGENDAVVVLGVLEIVFRQDGIAGRMRVPGEREVLLSDARRRARDLTVRAIALVAARNGILALAVVIIVVVVAGVIALATPATTPAMLLSLPHDLPISLFHSQIGFILGSRVNLIHPNAHQERFQTDFPRLYRRPIFPAD